MEKMCVRAISVQIERMARPVCKGVLKIALFRVQSAADLSEYERFSILSQLLADTRNALRMELLTGFTSAHTSRYRRSGRTSVPTDSHFARLKSSAQHIYSPAPGSTSSAIISARPAWPSTAQPSAARAIAAASSNLARMVRSVVVVMAPIPVFGAVMARPLCLRGHEGLAWSGSPGGVRAMRSGGDHEDGIREVEACCCGSHADMLGF
jgi:hypothetical protein